jgi:transcriptional regulator with GAF, ATPase, and Fis domain
MEELALIEQVKAANALTIRLGTILKLDQLVNELASVTRTLALSERSIVLVADEENATLSIAAVAADQSPTLNLTFSIYDRTAIGISAWYRGEPFFAAPGELVPESALSELAQKLGMDSFCSVPLRVMQTLVAVIIVDNPTTHQPISARGHQMLDAVKDTAAILVANAHLHSKILSDRDARVREL